MFTCSLCENGSRMILSVQTQRFSRIGVWVCFRLLEGRYVPEIPEPFRGGCSSKNGTFLFFCPCANRTNLLRLPHGCQPPNQPLSRGRGCSLYVAMSQPRALIDRHASTDVQRSSPHHRNLSRFRSATHQTLVFCKHSSISPSPDPPGAYPEGILSPIMKLPLPLLLR